MSRLIITTVGTSLLEKMTKPNSMDIRGVGYVNNPLGDNTMLHDDIKGWCDWINTEQAMTQIHTCTHVKPTVKLLRQLDQNNTGHRYAAPAEIASLWTLGKHLQEMGQLLSKDNGDRVVLLYSDTPEGVFCARCLQEYLNDYSGLAYCDWSADANCIKGLQAEGPGAYQTWEEAVKNLAELLRGQLKRAEDEGFKAWLNITGGYKGITPFSSLLGLLRGIPVVYLYETSDGLIRLPQIPLQLDVEAYELNSHLINVILNDGGTPESVGLPRNLHACVEPDNGGWKLTIWGELLEALSRQEGRIGGARVMAEEYWTDQALRKEILERVKRVADYLRVECKTPHMVTHGREHLGRLLEFVDEICIPILNYERTLPDEQRTFSCADLYTFVSYIWLHDIGHISGHLRDYDHPEVIDHPAVIRDLHHLLSEQRMKDEGCLRFVFPDGEHIDAVAKVSAYHRYAMPMHDSDDKPYEYKKPYYDGKPITIKEPPPKTMCFQHNGRQLKVKVRFLAALARIVDGCDVQRRRAGEPFYQQWRQMSRMMDIELEQRRVEQYEKDFSIIKQSLDDGKQTMVLDRILNELRARIDFNLKQDLHFEKHNQIERVWWQQKAPFKDSQGNYHFSIVIHQSQLKDVRRTRGEDMPKATVQMVRDYFVGREGGKDKYKQDCSELKAEVEKYCNYPVRLHSSLNTETDRACQNIASFIDSLANITAGTELNDDQEQQYSRLIIRLVAFDIVKEYAKVHDILNDSKVLLDAIEIRWADGGGDTIYLH